MGSLPPITFHQYHQWRRQMARCFDDLAAELAETGTVRPRCSGEEMALHRQELDNAREKRLTPREHQAAYGSDGLSGCWGKAHARLIRRTPRPEEVLLHRLANDAYETSRRDGKVTQVVRSWSACMQAKGLRYEDPITAAGDERWAQFPRPTHGELKTAVADVQCKAETGLVRLVSSRKPSALTPSCSVTLKQPRTAS